jgi:hypothetical protein
MPDKILSIKDISSRDLALIINAIEAYSHNTEYSELLARLQTNKPPVDAFGRSTNFVK